MGDKKMGKGKMFFCLFWQDSPQWARAASFIRKGKMYREEHKKRQYTIHKTKINLANKVKWK
jgi:hypothetical protein